ncbi:type IV secretion system protein [Paracoccus cavernae]|uniref:type IV secretion system protein n=2 Tax=Paracoccus cavernae TaxID=1571207 RepID=UPI0035F28746
MGIVSSILASIDQAIQSTGGQFFESTAQAMGPVAALLATILVIAVGLNVAIGAYALTIQDSMRLIWRIVLIFTFALSWRNFGTLYVALSDGAANLAMSFFDIAGGGPRSPGAAMDAFATQMGNTADTVLTSRGAIARGVLGAVLYLVLAGLMAAYVLVVGFAKIMIAFLLGVAPLAMVLTMFERTKGQFEAWLSAFVGYLLYPVAAAALISTIAMVAEAQFAPQENVNVVSDLLGFLVVALVGIKALLTIPQAASHLSGHIHLASFAPQAMHMASGGQRGAAFRSGLMTGKTPEQAAARRDRVWAEHGGNITKAAGRGASRISEKIRNAQILR